MRDPVLRMQRSSCCSIRGCTLPYFMGGSDSKVSNTTNAPSCLLFMSHLKCVLAEGHMSSNVVKASDVQMMQESGEYLLS